jgi:hypothetical protein
LRIKSWVKIERVRPGMVSIPVKMSTMSQVSIQIYLIRKDGASNSDDEIMIKKNLDTNEFTVTYTDSNDGDTIKHRMEGLYHAKVLDYVYYLMKNQFLDEEGFDKFQINMPALPRMIVGGDKFKDVYYRNHFYDLIGFGLDSLETTTSVKKVEDLRRARQLTELMNRYSTPSSNARQHLFFDE